MTANSQAVVGYYAEHCHPQLRGQAVYVQLADQVAEFKRDAIPQVAGLSCAHSCISVAQRISIQYFVASLKFLDCRLSKIFSLK